MVVVGELGGLWRVSFFMMRCGTRHGDWSLARFLWRGGRGSSDADHMETRCTARRDAQHALLGGLWVPSEIAGDGSNRTVLGESVTVLASDLLGPSREALSS